MKAKENKAKENRKRALAVFMRNACAPCPFPDKLNKAWGESYKDYIDYILNGNDYPLSDGHSRYLVLR